jgi:hypothetical protein
MLRTLVKKMKNEQPKIKPHGGQMLRLHNALSGGEWLTLVELRNLTAISSLSSLSAVLRQLRKPEHGNCKIEKRRRGAESRGLYEYRLIPGGEDRS